MSIPPETQNAKAANDSTSNHIPRQVWLATCLALLGTCVIAAVAIANGPFPGQVWSTGAPCVGIAGMLSIVCYALVRYR